MLAEAHFQGMKISERSLNHLEENNIRCNLKICQFKGKKLGGPFTCAFCEICDHSNTKKNKKAWAPTKRRGKR